VSRARKGTRDPAKGNMRAEFPYKSQLTQPPWDYLHLKHAGYNAMGETVDVTSFAPAHHHHDSHCGVRRQFAWAPRMAAPPVPRQDLVRGLRS